MGSRLLGGLVAALLTLTAVGCSGDDEPAAEPSASPPPAAPSYDASLEPSAAVLPLVPDDAVELTVTDYDEVRLLLGLPSLTTASPVADQDAFWARAESDTAILSTGMLRPVEAQLRDTYRLSQSDVAWEAHFFDDAGAELGWVLSLRAGTDAQQVASAVTAGVGPLAGSTWRPTDLLVTKGVAGDGARSWATDPVTPDLVGLGAVSTYVERSCVAKSQVPATLTALTQYSVQFEGGLVTARLGADRTDLFDRLRLATAFRPFVAAYDGGVADPLTGRLGFRMSRPALAADLALRRKLPFAACAVD